MSSGWQYFRLGELCKTSSGGTPLKNRKDFYEGGTIPWLRSGEVNNRNITDCEIHITEAGLKGSSAKLFPPRTVLIAMYGATAGQVGILNFECSTNQAVCGIYPNDKFIPEFLYYKFLEGYNELVSQATGGAQPNISQEKIKNTLIPLIPIEEQQQIVAVLDECFAAIDQAKANIEKNIVNAKELFQSKLNEIFSQKGEGWESRQLKDIAVVFGRGKSKHRPRNWDGLFGGDYPFIQTGEIRNANKYVSEYSQTYNDVGLAQSKLWKKDTICITIAANIAETAILGFDACFPDSIIGLQVDPEKADLDFTYYLLQSFKAELQKLGKGSAQDNINLGTFENRMFPFPKSISEQQEIVRKLDNMRLEIQKLDIMYQKKLNDIEELKKSILQKAFSGELSSKKLDVA